MGSKGFYAVCESIFCDPVKTSTNKLKKKLTTKNPQSAYTHMLDSIGSLLTRRQATGKNMP